MFLTQEERAMLAGQEGPAVQKAMRIVVALAEIYEASSLVPVSSAQISGVSYKNLGEAGLEFLEEWASLGARIRVPAFMNPAGMDMERWRDMGIAPEFARQQERVVAALRAMGVTATCTCTPYLVGYVPQAGEHLAWSESSAVVYANSVLGAFSNREGGPSALAAAITGRTGAYGLHLPENRRATHLVDVYCGLLSEADYGALGYIIGQQVADGVPYLRLRGGSGSLPRREDLMALGAAMAASGAVALFFLEGLGPAALDASASSPNPKATDHGSLPQITVEDLAAGYAALDSGVEEVDLVSLGCPHSTLDDIARVARFLEGKRVKTTLWVTTSRGVRETAEREGWVAQIEAAGGKVFADTCLVVAPVGDMGFRCMATNSAKAAFYAPAHSGLTTRFGTLEQCVAAALSGRWTGGSRGQTRCHR